jgi:dUTP pyrophosphatase
MATFDNILKVKLLSASARLPMRGSVGAAGLDLFSCELKVLPAKKWCVVNTDVAVQMPPGCYGRIAGRSGLGCNQGIFTGAGVVDPDYRGSIRILLFNFGEVDWPIKPGDRVAQLILERYVPAYVIPVFALEPTLRGTLGLGSTGL